MSLPEVRLCRDCKHIKGWPGSFLQCVHPENATVSLVTGGFDTKNTINYCREDGHCGQSGQHWEAVA